MSKMYSVSFVDADKKTENMWFSPAGVHRKPQLLGFCLPDSRLSFAVSWKLVNHCLCQGTERWRWRCIDCGISQTLDIYKSPVCCGDQRDQNHAPDTLL